MPIVIILMILLVIFYIKSKKCRSFINGSVKEIPNALIKEAEKKKGSSK